jgi:ADP-heptose:LPS heptosyltransferase
MAQPWSSVGSIKTDCRWFKGDVPCVPHKRNGVHCVDDQGATCPYYDPLTSRILIIKLGAIGDVIRTTPLLHRLKADHPRAQIWWLTLTPEVLPADVDIALPYSPQGMAALHATHFDLLVNLDKSREACALAATVRSSTKKGFTLVNGMPAPIDNDAAHKFLMGLFDDLNRENTKSYPQEIFEVCGLTFAGERYILDPHDREGYVWNLPTKKPIVGLNTGCGGRWTSRLWAEKNWVVLARALKKAGYAPLLLGGAQEDAKNRRIATKSGATYLGHFPLPQFISLVDHCHVVVTAVTMAMHITIGLGKRIVLFNNIFNRNEFELYGLGEILEPGIPCTCFYSPVCPSDCMRHITVRQTLDACLRQIREASPGA